METKKYVRTKEHEENLRKSHNKKEYKDKQRQGSLGNKRAWKGGKRKNSAGYVLVYSLNHTCSPYVYEHRLVVESYLGRFLNEKEVVHHINGIKEDNRADNLMVFLNNGSHIRWHKNPSLVKPEEIIFRLNPNV